jgi:hypothetical protein
LIALPEGFEMSDWWSSRIDGKKNLAVMVAHRNAKVYAEPLCIEVNDTLERMNEKEIGDFVEGHIKSAATRLQNQIDRDTRTMILAG